MECNGAHCFPLVCFRITTLAIVVWGSVLMGFFGIDLSVSRIRRVELVLRRLFALFVAILTNKLSTVPWSYAGSWACSAAATRSPDTLTRVCKLISNFQLKAARNFSLSVVLVGKEKQSLSTSTNCRCIVVDHSEGRKPDVFCWQKLESESSAPTLTLSGGPREGGGILFSRSIF